MLPIVESKPIDDAIAIRSRLEAEKRDSCVRLVLKLVGDVCFITGFFETLIFTNKEKARKQWISKEEDIYASVRILFLQISFISLA